MLKTLARKCLCFIISSKIPTHHSKSVINFAAGQETDPGWRGLPLERAARRELPRCQIVAEGRGFCGAHVERSSRGSELAVHTGGRVHAAEHAA